MKYESIYIKMDIFPEQLFSLISDYKREMNPTVFFTNIQPNICPEL